MTILGKMAEAIAEPREELSQYAPRISAIQIDTEKIGTVIGKGGETIRALSEEFEAQIDVDDDGTVRVYAQTGEQGDALVDRIRSMTKEVEVGDEFTGKVVKTTTFGAFVELVQGHRRPAAHLERQARRAGRHGRGRAQPRRRDRRASGRGRPRARPHRPAPGRRPGDRGQVRRGAGGRRHGRQRPARRPRRRGGDGRGRRPRERDRRPRERERASADATGDAPDPSWRAPRPSPEPAPADHARLGRPGRDRGDALRALDRARLLGPHRARATSRPSRPGISHFLEHLLFKGTDRFSSLEIDETLRRDGGGGQRRHRQGDDLGLLALPRPCTSSAPSTCSRTWCCGRPTRTSTPSARS